MKLPHPRGTSADIREGVTEIRKEAERERQIFSMIDPDAYKDDDDDINWPAVFGLAFVIDAIAIGVIVLMVKACSA